MSPTVQATPIAPLEKIYGVDVAAHHIHFKVLSNGCTKPADFRLKLSNIDDNRVEITLLRIKPDYCKMRPKLISIKQVLPDDVLQGVEIKVLNPLMPKPDIPGLRVVQ